MIRENQQLLNRLNVISDGVISFLTIPLAYFIRFYVMTDGIENVPLRNYLILGAWVCLAQLFTNAALGLYQTSRRTRIRDEVVTVVRSELIVSAVFLGALFIGHNEYYSRWLIAIWFALSTLAVAGKHVLTRRTLRRLRRNGRNLKRLVLVGSGEAAVRFLGELERERETGYEAVGYVSRRPAEGLKIPYLGGYEALAHVLGRWEPDEVVSAVDAEDYGETKEIINACEHAGVKLSIIPLYAEYMSAHPQFDELGGIPLMNIRRIPLDNFANAFLKRAMDIAGALLLIILSSPVMLFCAAGVKLSSPGPVLFRQRRIGKDKKAFYMLKFRSMRVNGEQDTAWSTNEDPRRTHFGAFLRKYSLDELPQFLNVLAGSMSLVGPRPEIPKFVDKFKDEIPLYMVRHQVRPGITGWAQINGFRGDTPIKERVEHDVYYIENWSVWLDLRILISTVLRGKFINDERLG